MTEVQFLIELLKSEELPQSARTKLLDRVSALVVEMPKVTIPQTPNLTWPQTIGPAQWQQTLQDLCDHDYPTMWYGLTPPACTKCGKLAHPGFTVTCDGLVK